MFNVTYFAFRVCDLFSSLTTSSAVTVSKPFCGLLSQLSSQKDLWAGKPFWLLMCDWVLFLSCRIVFGFCFCWAFLPSCLPAGALCCAGGGRSPSACSFISFTYPFPRLSCCFLSLPCSDLLIFLFAIFHCSFLFWGCFPPSPFCFISLGYSLLPLIPLWLFVKCRTFSGIGQNVILQLLYEPRRDILDIEVAVFLSLCMPELPPQATDLLWEPRENGKGILKLPALYP